MIDYKRKKDTLQKGILLGDKKLSRVAISRASMLNQLIEPIDSLNKCFNEGWSPFHDPLSAFSRLLSSLCFISSTALPFGSDNERRYMLNILNILIYLSLLLFLLLMSSFPPAWILIYMIDHPVYVNYIRNFNLILNHDHYWLYCYIDR